MKSECLVERYVTRKIDAAPRKDCAWIVIDASNYTVARINDTWLEYLTEDEAARLAEKLNQMDAVSKITASP